MKMQLIQVDVVVSAIAGEKKRKKSTSNEGDGWEN